MLPQSRRDPRYARFSRRLDGPNAEPVTDQEIQQLQDLALNGMCRDLDFARVLDFDLPTFREAKRRDPRVHLAIQRAIATVDADLYAAQLRLALSGNPYMLGWLGRHRLDQNQQPLQIHQSTTSLNLNLTVEHLLDPANITQEKKDQLRFLRDAIYGEDQHEVPDIRDVESEVVPSKNGDTICPFPTSDSN